MIQFEDVHFSFGKNKVLNGLSFSASSGEVLAIAGPNGAGKTTTLSICAGISKPQSGKAQINGSVGYVPQEAALFEDMSVKDNIRFFAALCGKKVPEVFPLPIDSYLKKKVSKLSGGMKKRLSIVCALISDPDILILDEPCAALDITVRDELITLVKSLRDKGKTIIYTSHSPEEIEAVFDRLLLLNSGKSLVLEKKEVSGSVEEKMREWFSES